MTKGGDAGERDAAYAARLASRGDLTGFLMALSQRLGADSYMLIAVRHEKNRSDLRILASSWMYDAIQLAGHQLIAAIGEGPLTAPPGTRPRPITPARACGLDGVMDGEQAQLLNVLGHGEIYALRIHVGRHRFFLLLSTEEAGVLDAGELMKAQMQCCYTLSRMPELLAAASLRGSLSERERECLFWVSEGKTSEEIAMILGVAVNTVNSYVANAMQKTDTSNRAMAVATAIRSGII